MPYVATALNFTPLSDSQTMSADGRYVAMIGASGEANAGHLLLQDLQTGATRDLVPSVSYFTPIFSPDGSKLLYYAISAASGNIQLYMVDVMSGQSQIISVDGSGRELSLGSNFRPERADLSNGGRFVVFATANDGVVANDHNGKRDIYLKDTLTGSLSLVSQTAAGIAANDDSSSPLISPDGATVVFSTYAPNLLPDQNNPSLMYSFRLVMKNLQTGQIQFADRDSSGKVYDYYYNAMLTQDGQKLLFSGTQYEGMSRRDMIWEKDLNSGLIKVVSSTANGSLLQYATLGGASADGRYVFLTTPDRNLAGGDAESTNDLYRKDMLSGELSWLTPHDFTNATGALMVGGVSADGTKILLQYPIPNFFGEDWRPAAGGSNGLVNYSSYLLSVSGDGERSGRDSLFDPGGSALLAGGGGNDSYWIDAAGTRAQEAAGAGTDTVFSRLADYTLPENIENLVLAGNGTALAGVQTGRGNTLDNRFYGNNHNNTFYGGDGNDSFDPAGGIDVVYGGNGSDTVFMRGASFSGVTRQNGGQLTASDGLSTVTMSNIERVEGTSSGYFQSGAIQAEQAYRIYQAAFNRTPDSGGLGFWIKQIDNGMSVSEVAKGFIQSAEFKSLYGTAPSNTEMVDKFYQNVLHRIPDGGGRAFWIDALDQKKASAPEVLAAFSESPENKAALVGVFDAGVTYQVYQG